MTQNLLLLCIRVSLGWYMFYAGITKVLNPEWTSAGFLANAKTFPEFYAWFAQPGILPITDLLNSWGLTLVGVSLMLGVAVRLGGVFGASMLVLYYFPAFVWPHPTPYTYLVDEHVVFAFVMLYLAAVHTGRVWGLGRWISRLRFVEQRPLLRRLVE